MPAASTSSQPENPLAWFDSAEGSAVLVDEMGLLMPLLVRCPGQRVCHVLPTARAAANAQPTLMPIETRLWCDGAGWHGDFGTLPDGPPRALHGQDLVIAAHVIATLPEPQARLEAIYRMLATGGTAYFVEFYPWSLYRRRWRGRGLGALSLRRLLALVRAAGFEVSATYALRPRSSLDSTGMLLRHNWRLPSWFPLRAYAIRACKREPGMTLVGAQRAFPLEAPNA